MMPSKADSRPKEERERVAILLHRLRETKRELDTLSAGEDVDCGQTRRELSEEKQQSALRALAERVKELRALHKVSRLLRKDGLELPDLLAQTAAIVCRAMQYPDVAEACVGYGKTIQSTPGFRERPYALEAFFCTKDGTTGFVRVVYLEEKPSADEGPFLSEERRLVESLAELLRLDFELWNTVKALTKSEERIAEQAALIDAAHEAILVKDLDGRVIFWNKGAERTFGWTSKEAVGVEAVELFGIDRELYGKARAELMANGLWKGEFDKQTKAGRRLTVAVSWTLVRDGEGRPKSILAINHDITDRKKLEQQFLRSQRMEGIGTLAGGIAHDLNNVLTPILMGVDLLRTNEDDPVRRQTLSAIEASALRGASMIRQVLSFARGAEGKGPINLCHVVGEIERILRDTFPKNIVCEVEMDENLWSINADPTQLHQMLMNLCVNARDAMPDGGKLGIVLENMLFNQSDLKRIPNASPGPYVKINVKDGGPGIPKEIQEKIFDPFFTTKETGKGTGLGLFTVLNIVTGHGGFLDVFNKPGRGARFQVHLPALGDSKDSANAPPAPTSLPRSEGELILVVDDEESIRTLARKTLEMFGYRVLLAKNGAEAVSVYATRQEEIALVLTDMGMPVMDGPTLVTALKSLDPAIRIVAMSGFGKHSAETKAVAAGVHHFLQKPYTTETLIRTMHQVLHCDPQGNGR